ncbi:uncharacterized protein [Cardiocondyla obscurior]|uniref:uncharacterized protein n=1 Tax=Cardiocondyla obscurior TaxID=286306 RepID=UPI0039656930
MILRRPCRNLAAFFRAMWSKKILDAIVVEYLKPGRSDKRPATVHRYDPFTDSHTEEPYSSASTTWFADDFPNMRGYPLVYAFPRRPPYSDVVTTPRGYESKGLDKILTDILANKMNFTGVPEIITNPTYFQKTHNGSQYGLMMDVTFGKYDAILTTLPMSGKVPGIQHTVQDTYPLLIENWCFAVPKLIAKQDFAVGTAIRLLLINFSIIGVFWLCARFMKFGSGTWNFLRIIGMILAASFPPAPKKLHERVIFLSVLAVSVSYSSMLFVELTSVGFENNYAQFDCVEDLLKSDLTPVIHKDIWNLMQLFNNDFKGPLHKSGKKILHTSGSEVCLRELIMHQNVSCFVYEDWAKLTAVKNMRNGKTVMKTTKLCYWSPLAVKVFSPGSPYVKRVDDLFLMLWSGGIRDKWYREYLRNETKATAFETHRDHSDIPRVSVFHPIIYVLTTGYLISAVVLIGELIWKYFDINLNLSLF